MWRSESFEIKFDQIQFVEYEQKTEVQSDASTGASSVHRFANVYLNLRDGTKFKLDSGNRAALHELAERVASAVGVPLRSY